MYWFECDLGADRPLFLLVAVSSSETDKSLIDAPAASGGQDHAILEKAA